MNQPDRDSPDKHPSTILQTMRRIHRGVRFVGTLALIGIVIAIGVLFVASHIHSGPSSETVATASGSDRCDSSGYQIISRLDSSKATIFNCWTNTKERCVTYQHNIASDSTEEVRLLFSTALSGKPDCVG